MLILICVWIHPPCFWFPPFLLLSLLPSFSISTCLTWPARSLVAWTLLWYKIQKALTSQVSAKMHRYFYTLSITEIQIYFYHNTNLEMEEKFWPSSVLYNNTWHRSDIVMTVNLPLHLNTASGTWHLPVCACVCVSVWSAEGCFILHRGTWTHPSPHHVPGDAPGPDKPQSCTLHTVC